MKVHTILFSVSFAALSIAAALDLSSRLQVRHPRPDPMAQWNRRMADLKSDSERETLRQYIRMYALDYGDDAAAFYQRCTTEPPSHPANQARCQTTQNRMKQMIAAYEAKTAEEKAKW